MDRLKPCRATKVIPAAPPTRGRPLKTSYLHPWAFIQGGGAMWRLQIRQLLGEEIRKYYY